MAENTDPIDTAVCQLPIDTAVCQLPINTAVCQLPIDKPTDPSIPSNSSDTADFIRDNELAVKLCQDGNYEELMNHIDDNYMSVQMWYGDHMAWRAAVERRDIKICECLIYHYKGSITYIRDVMMFSACCTGDVDLVKFLIGIGESIEASKRCRMIRSAASIGNLDMTLLLLRNSARAHNIFVEFWVSALISSLYSGNIDTIKHLVLNFPPSVPGCSHYPAKDYDPQALIRGVLILVAQRTRPDLFLELLHEFNLEVNPNSRAAYPYYRFSTTITVVHKSPIIMCNACAFTELFWHCNKHHNSRMVDGLIDKIGSRLRITSRYNDCLREAVKLDHTRVVAFLTSKYQFDRLEELFSQVSKEGMIATASALFVAIIQADLEQTETDLTNPQFRTYLVTHYGELARDYLSKVSLNDFNRLVIGKLASRLTDTRTVRESIVPTRAPIERPLL
ncbi:Hypothetical protein MVR_LOCUS142 [uncultured virus]|nr:Hypothetical protein MVR_LOCUS142 [uncultured virus]